MAHEIHQALFGYSDGHGVLATSQPLDPRKTRRLRALTDMAFDGVADRYLTCLPVTALRQQALIRTWPAPESKRPGSVWSHALFLDFVDLGEAQQFRTLLKLFRYPEIDTDGAPNLEPYEVPIASQTTVDSRTAVTSADHPTNELVVWACYGTRPPALIRARTPEALEPSMMALWEQQWPKLRRSFSFRTRFRGSIDADGFDVQVVERLGRGQDPVEIPSHPAPWVERLAIDMSHPDKDLRAFLRRFGPDSANGRGELSSLVEIQGMLASGKRAAVPSRLWTAFPEAAQMRSLKRELFGITPEPETLWRAPESERLKFALQASPASAVDLDELDVRKRLDALWQTKPKQAIKVLTGTSKASPEARRLVEDSTTAAAPASELALLSEREPDLVTAAVHRRPRLLAHGALWTGPPAAREIAHEAFLDTPPHMREQILADLIRADDRGAARALVEQDPATWWLGLELEANRINSMQGSLAGATDRLATLLDAAGPAAVGSSPSAITNGAALQLLAVILPPKDGLWRQVSWQQWANHADELAEINPESLRLRATVVLLLAARITTNASSRKRLWLAAFGPLHAILLRARVAPLDRESLEILLPGSDSDDFAARLRHAAADIVVRDQWPPTDTQAIMDGAHPFESELVTALKSKRKKPKGWWRNIVDQLLL